ncbi:MAG: carboxypeptidase-like regulatory domain-containing protein [Candidatus Aminicenantales bacterium]
MRAGKEVVIISFFIISIIISIYLVLPLQVFSAPQTQYVSTAPQGMGSMTGYVYGPDRTTPVKGAVVKLKNINTGLITASGPTDSRGAFFITGLRAGTYLLGVSTLEGNFNTDKLIGIKENQVAKISFSLSPYKREVADAIQDVYGENPPKGVRRIRRIGFNTRAGDEGERKKTEWEDEVWEVRVGKVINYLPQTNEAAVYLIIGLLQIGDEIHVRGYVTNFFQKVKGLRLNGTYVKRALAGQTPLVEVERPVEVGDFIYLVCGKKLGYFMAPYGLASIIAGAGAIFYGFVITEPSEPEESPFKR